VSARQGELPDTVVVEGEDGPCTIVFNEVVTLKGSIVGELPRLPVTVGPNGGWVTATYDPGKVAIWSAAGEFRRTIGEGPGGGPGEFGRVSDIAVDTATGRIYIFTSSNRIEVYGDGGEYLETISLPRYSSWGTLLHDGTVVAVLARATAEPVFAVVKPDTVMPTGPVQRGPAFPPLLYGNGDGVWTVESAWYEIRRHDMRDGQVDFQITRETPLFPAPRVEEIERLGGPVVVAFAVDTRQGRVFAVLKQVLKPGHSPPPVAQPETPLIPIDAANNPYYGAVIEAFDFAGNVLASLRLDDGESVPYPMMSLGSRGLWYEVLSDDIRSIRILRPSLEKR
jgi:hypothetical protein